MHVCDILKKLIYFQVIYPSQKKTIFLDPLGESKEKVRKCLETTRAFMTTKGCQVSRWSCESPTQYSQTARQSNFSP
ncbi:sentrin-specific protease-like [Huso huso]|uniref:Sentrin-specific protease-like n=1 Tax=Huso huso TaxID=61971 RepID=A0ABR0Z4W4_HUSHU